MAWGLGYLGGMIVLIAVVTLMAASPETGKTISASIRCSARSREGEDARITGPISALWYLVFILPMFFFTPDAGEACPWARRSASGLRTEETLNEARQRRGILRFLIARMIYQDGVNALIGLGGAFAAACSAGLPGDWHLRHRPQCRRHFSCLAAAGSTPFLDRRWWFCCPRAS